MNVSARLAAWLRRLGVPMADASTVGPHWLGYGDVSALSVAAQRLERLGDELDDVRVRLAHLLGGTSRTSGWEGQAADVAADRTARTGAQLAELSKLLRALGRELSRHGMRVEDRRAELRVLLDEAEHHAAATATSAAGASPLTLLGEPTDGHDHVGALHRLAQRLNEVLDDAAHGDQACASHVVDLGAAVLDLVARAESHHWFGDLVPRSARAALAGGSGDASLRSPSTSEDR